MGSQMITQEHAEAPIDVYQFRPARVWVWFCRLCERDDIKAYRLVALADGLHHLRTAHGCPSMLASGEPCDDYCTDCGGRMWIK